MPAAPAREVRQLGELCTSPCAFLIRFAFPGRQTSWWCVRCRPEWPPPLAYPHFFSRNLLNQLLQKDAMTAAPARRSRPSRRHGGHHMRALCSSATLTLGLLCATTAFAQFTHQAPRNVGENSRSVGFIS